MISDIAREIRAIDTGAKNIRNFGLVFFAVFSLIGAVFLYKGRTLGYCGLGLGVLFLALGMWAPAPLRPLYRIWVGLSLVLGFFMSRLILCIVFYLVLTPIGVVMRVLGKDMLDQRWDKGASSYWIKKKKRPADKKQYEKLY